jgi:hypothetical protein
VGIPNAFFQAVRTIRWLVDGAFTEHCEENVPASSLGSDQGLVVVFALRSFPVAVGPRGWVPRRCEG